MAPGLQKRYPDIKTYTGRDVNNPHHLLKMEIGPRGFHAMVFTDKGSFLIEPTYKDNLTDYAVFRKQDVLRESHDRFSCLVSNSSIKPDDSSTNKSFQNPTGTE